VSTAGAPVRGRRPARSSGDDRQRAILATAERLLAERSLSALSVDDLARGAGISRPTFYFYFAGKEDVLLELLDRMVAEVGERLAALPRIAESEPDRWWRGVLGVFVDVFTAHQAVSRTLGEARATIPELGRVWSSHLTRWTEETALVIEHERRRGAASPGIDAATVSIALNAMNERVLTATLAGESPAVPADRVLDVLAAVWLATVYGRGPAAP
jgi:AcrR family transcriptional regulator